MFPIRDHNPSTRTPYVTLALILANVAIFLAYFPAIASTQAEFRFYATWGMIPSEITAGRNLPTLLSAMFLHGGWMHLLGNMLFLWIFGDNLEDRLGHALFFGFYMVAGLGAGMAQVLVDPSSPVPTIGASGAIAGVLGGYLLLFPRARVDVLIILIVFFRIFAIPAWIVLGIWFGLQVLNGTATSAASDGVAYWEHIGGFVVGFVLMLPVWLSLGGAGFWKRTHGVPDHPETRLSGSTVPLIPRKR